MDDTKDTPVGREETDIAPAGPGTRSDTAGSAPQAGSGASETGPAPTSGEGEHLTGDDPQTQWLRDAPGGPAGLETEHEESRDARR